MAAIIEFEGRGEQLIATLKEATDSTIKLKDETSKAGEANKKYAGEAIVEQRKLAITIDGTADAMSAVRKEAEKGGQKVATTNELTAAQKKQAETVAELAKQYNVLARTAAASMAGIPGSFNSSIESAESLSGYIATLEAQLARLQASPELLRFNPDAITQTTALLDNLKGQLGAITQSREEAARLILETKELTEQEKLAEAAAKGITKEYIAAAEAAKKLANTPLSPPKPPKPPAPPPPPPAPPTPPTPPTPGVDGIAKRIKDKIGGAVSAVEKGFSSLGSVGIAALGPIGAAAGVVATGIGAILNNTNEGRTAFKGFEIAGQIAFDKITGSVLDLLSVGDKTPGVFGKVVQGIGSAAAAAVQYLNPVVLLLQATGLDEEIEDAVTAGQKYAQALSDIEAAQNRVNLATSENDIIIAENLAKLKDTTKPLKERLEIADQINKAETANLNLKRGQVAEELKLLITSGRRQLLEKGSVDDALIKQITDAQVELNALKTDSVRLTETVESRKANITQQYSDRAIAAAKQEAALLAKIDDDILKAKEALAKKLQEQTLEQADPRQRLELQRNAAIEEVRILERTLQEKIALQRIEQEVGAETFAKLSEAQKKARTDALIDGGQVELAVAQQEQITGLEVAAWQKYYDERLALERSNQAALLELQGEGFEKEKQGFELELSARVDKLREAGATIVQVEAFIQRERDKFRTGQVQKAITEEETLALARIDAQVRGAESERVFRQRIELEKLATSESFAQQRLTAIEGDTSAEAELLRAELQGTINEIQAKRAELEANAPKADIFELLGINITEGQKAQLINDLKSIGQSVLDFATSNIEAQQAVLNAQLETTDEVIADQQRRRDELQGQLDQALEDQRAGYANDADALKAAIQLTVEAENAALAEKKRIQAEQAKLARQQVLIDATAQASALALSTANLIKSWSTIPFGIGLVSAFAQGLAIVSTFAGIRSKIKAASAPQFRHGGEIQGPSHEHGGVALLDRRSGQHFAEAEGGEFMVKKESYRKFPNLIRSLNEGDMHKAQEAAIKELLGNTIQLDGDRITKIVRMKEEYIQNTTVVNKTENDGLRKDMKRLTGIVEAFMEQEGTRETTTGNVTKKPGKTVRIRG